MSVQQPLPPLPGRPFDPDQRRSESDLPSWQEDIEVTNEKPASALSQILIIFAVIIAIHLISLFLSAEDAKKFVEFYSIPFLTSR